MCIREAATLHFRYRAPLFRISLCLILSYPHLSKPRNHKGLSAFLSQCRTHTSFRIVVGTRRGRYTNCSCYKEALSPPTTHTHTHLSLKESPVTLRWETLFLKSGLKQKPNISSSPPSGPRRGECSEGKHLEASFLLDPMFARSPFPPARKFL